MTDFYHIRCIGLTTSRKRCRQPLNKHNLIRYKNKNHWSNFFCCEKHIPFNLSQQQQFNCPICFDDIIDRKQIIVLKCNHAFCRDCWNLSKKNNKYNLAKCALCRFPSMK